MNEPESNGTSPDEQPSSPGLWRERWIAWLLLGASLLIAWGIAAVLGWLN